MAGKGKHSICRLCLSHNAQLHNVFKSKGTPGWTAADAILELLSIQVSAGDKYPHFICIDCMRTLEDFKVFKQQCESNMKVLDAMYPEIHAFVSNEEEIEICIKDELEIPIMEDSLHFNEEGNPLKARIEDQCNGSNELPSADEIGSAHPNSIQTKGETVKSLRAVNTEQDNTMDNSLTKGTLLNQEISAENVGNESIIYDPDYVIKEEVVDIPADSDSEESAKEDMPFALEDQGTAPPVENNGMVTLQRIDGSSHSHNKVFGEIISQPHTEDQGSVNVSSSVKADYIMRSAVKERTSTTHLLNTEMSMQSCYVRGKINAQSEDMEAHSSNQTAEKTYSCKLCSRGNYVSESVEYHLCKKVVEVVPKELNCCWCGEGFYDLYYLQRHELMHGGHEMFQCYHCSEAFHDKCLLKIHLLAHSNFKRLECDICHEILSNKSSLKAHMKIHLLLCHVCRMEFYLKENLEQHLITHLGEGSLKHTDSDMSLPMMGNLEKQMWNHYVDKALTSNMCSRAFSQKSQIKTHILTHSGKAPFTCNICSKTFTLKANLKSHMIIHSGEKSFSCCICSKRFYYKGNFNIHMLTHSGEKPFTCKICNKKFYYKSSLSAHMVTHSGDKQFTCNVCSKTFYYKISLNRHMVTHSGKKPFACNICSKTFYFKDILNSHMLTHSGKKPFACNICSRAFSQKSNLRRHMGTH